MVSAASLAPALNACFGIEANSAYPAGMGADSTGEATAATTYARCQVLQPGASMLVTTHEAPAASYTAQAALREQLYETVMVP